MFKNSQGTFFTKTLFFETNVGDKDKIVYTLKNEDHNGYPSLKKLLFDTEDLTGYTLAVNHLGGWDHLLKLLELDWFKVYWDSWISELEVKIRAEALLRLNKESKNKDSRAYVELNKFMLNKGWILPEDRKPQKKRGAPTKAEIIGAAITIAQEDETLASDLRRVTQTTLN